MAGEDNDAFARVLTQATVKGSGAGTLALEVRPDGEGDPSAVVFGGALGTAGSRPLDPDSDGAAEAIAARSSDGLPVLVLRDLRIEAAAGVARKGTVRLAGYHGALVAIADQGDGTSLVVVSGSDLRVPDTAIVQGDIGAAKDVALAEPAVALLAEMGPIVLELAAAMNILAPGSVTPFQITNLTTKLAPYLVLASGPTPAAPTTRAPKLRGAPGA